MITLPQLTTLQSSLADLNRVDPVVLDPITNLPMVPQPLGTSFRTQQSANTDSFGGLMNHTSTGCQTLGTVFGAIGDAMFGSPDGLHSGITGIMQNAGEAMQAIGDAVGRLGDLLDGCLTTLGTLISNFANLTGATLALLDSVVTSLTAAADAAVNAAIDGLAAVAGKLGEALSAVGDAVGTLLNLAGDVVSAVVNAGCGLIADGLVGLTGVTPEADQATKASAAATAAAAAAAAGLPPVPLVTPFTPALGDHVMGSCTATSAALQSSLNKLNDPLLFPSPTPLDLTALTAAAASLNGLVP